MTNSRPTGRNHEPHRVADDFRAPRLPWQAAVAEPHSSDQHGVAVTDARRSLYSLVTLPP